MCSGMRTSLTGSSCVTAAALDALAVQTASLAQSGRHQQQKWRSAQRSLLVGASLLVALGSCFAAFLARLPPLKEEDLEVLRGFPPRTLPDLAAQRDVLLAYAAASPAAVAAGYCGAYILMQSFAIPGTIMLSLLAGGLYGVWRGCLLVAVVSTLGSCCCYCMSWALGQPLAHALWPERLESYAGEVRQRRGHLLNYIIFLRVTPILPNTFINVASPIVGVPLAPFALGTVLGCLPNNFVAVNAGSRLGELQSLSDLYDTKLLALGALVGLVALAPIYLKHRHAASGRSAAS